MQKTKLFHSRATTRQLVNDWLGPLVMTWLVPFILLSTINLLCSVQYSCIVYISGLCTDACSKGGGALRSIKYPETIIVLLWMYE